MKNMPDENMDFSDIPEIKDFSDWMNGKKPRNSEKNYTKVANKP